MITRFENQEEKKKQKKKKKENFKKIYETCKEVICPKSAMRGTQSMLNKISAPIKLIYKFEQTQQM